MNNEADEGEMTQPQNLKPDPQIALDLHATLVEDFVCPNCLGNLDPDAYCKDCGADALEFHEPEWC